MKTHTSGSMKEGANPPLTDEELEDMVSVLWENIDGLPHHIQELLHNSTLPGNEGMLSYVLLTGWVTNHFEYFPYNPWNGKGPGWDAKDMNVN